MNKWNRPFFLLPVLVLALLFVSTPAGALAEGNTSYIPNTSGALPASDTSSGQSTDTDTIIQVNPLYANVFSETDLENTLSAIPLPYEESDASEVPSFDSPEDASAYLRAALVSRSTRAAFSYITEDDDYYHVVRGLFSQALEETGSPEEGDYLRYQYGGYSCSIRYSETDGSYHYTLTYTISCYTTIEQEQQVTDAAEQILSGLNLNGKTAYEKAEAIYRYLVSTVSYDYDHLYDTEYTLKYSAYAALIDKTAICQGYAVALYRLLMEAGIPCRVIGGMAGSQSHAWNIVQLRGFWYNADPTWDSESWDPCGSYSWFLLSDENFSSHTRDEQYLTDEFYRSYPMGTDNFSFRIFLAQPAVSLSNSASGITIKWSEVKGAAGYYIYRKVSGGWKKVKTVKGASASGWTETGLSDGTRYLYSVRAFYGSIESSGFPYRSIYRISRPSVFSLKNTGSRKLIIKWRNNKSATGCQIQYSTDSSFKNAGTITVSTAAASAKLLQKTISSLSKGKRYYVRIRICKTAQGTRSYSAWSPVKNVKISR